MRIAIREQLGLLVLLCCLVCIAVLSVAVWITNTNFVTSVSSDSLSLAATLYAEQLGTNIILIQNSIESIASRVLIQSALGRYAAGNNSNSNWIRAEQDLEVGLGTGGASQYLLQARIYGANNTGSAGKEAVISTTSNSTVPIVLPRQYGNGTSVILGDDTPEGYPQVLYPYLDFESKRTNSSYANITGSFLGTAVNTSAPLIVGPYQINNTFALASMTIPVVNNTQSTQVLGWMTILFSSDLLYLVTSSVLGLGNSGINLLVSPNTTNNRLPSKIDANSDWVRFVVPPVIDSNRASDRHPRTTFPDTQNFTYASFPAVESVFASPRSIQQSAGSLLDTSNEDGNHVSVGYARVNTLAADWAIIVEESYDEVHEPFVNLRNVLLACIFGSIGAILLLIFPLAHYSVGPIRELRAATNRTVDPFDFSEAGDMDGHDPSDNEGNVVGVEQSSLDEEHHALARKEGFIARVNPFHKKQRTLKLPTPPGERKFRIPGKVKDGKHIIYDELSDLTTTFNGMCDELMMQYARLEERVKERTAELELSKKAAEAANESKTLFIANISHELKTPLNGIMGMCAVSMSEDDPSKIKKSLNIIYKSGDLLLNLLTDLLTFSKNQIGQHLTLDEKEFRLADISSQVLSIFDKQAKEGQITLDVIFDGPSASLDTASGNPGQPGFGPFGTGRVKDMYLWGDQHRILQVVINLVSNSLKFTPLGGAVTVRVQCVGEIDPEQLAKVERKESTMTRDSKVSGMSRTSQNSTRTSKKRSRNSSSKSSMKSPGPSPQLHPERGGSRNMHTALEINSREPKTLSSGDSDVAVGPPINAKVLLFKFEVQDTGPGIPPAQQQKIFEPFVQGDLGLSKKYGGTGLGLSICSQLASLMKGSMDLKSVEGEGSCFSMQIPLRFVKERAESTSSSAVNSNRNSLSLTISHDPEVVRAGGNDLELSPASPTRAIIENPSSKPRLIGLSQPFFAPSPSIEAESSRVEAMERMKAEAELKGSKVRVLVAEDNKVNQEVVLRMLKLEDIYDVTVAKDGQEAYELVKKSMESDRPFSLIFMDVQMPNLDGLQSTRLIRATGYSAPIVALTAFAEESNVKECMESGMDFFLPKPIRRPALKQVLKRYCATIPESDEPESPPMSTTQRNMNTMLMSSSSEPSSADSTTPRPGSTAQTTPAFFDGINPLEQSVDHERGNENQDVSPLS